MKKLIALLSLVLTLGLVGCSSKSEVKDIPVSDIKSAINNETLLPIQPIFDIDAKEFYVFENVKDDIKERTYIIKFIRKVIDNSLNLLGINPRYI